MQALRTVGRMSPDPCLRLFFVEARVIIFVAHFTIDFAEKQQTIKFLLLCSLFYPKWSKSVSERVHRQTGKSQSVVSRPRFS